MSGTAMITRDRTNSPIIWYGRMPVPRWLFSSPSLTNLGNKPGCSLLTTVRPSLTTMTERCVRFETRGKRLYREHSPPKFVLGKCYRELGRQAASLPYPHFSQTVPPLFLCMNCLGGKLTMRCGLVHSNLHTAPDRPHQQRDAGEGLRLHRAAARVRVAAEAHLDRCQPEELDRPARRLRPDHHRSRYRVRPHPRGLQGTAPCRDFAAGLQHPGARRLSARAAAHPPRLTRVQRHGAAPSARG